MRIGNPDEGHDLHFSGRTLVLSHFQWHPRPIRLWTRQAIDPLTQLLTLPEPFEPKSNTANQYPISHVVTSSAKCFSR